MSPEKDPVKRDDKNFMLRAVTNDNTGLSYASPRLKDDKELVLVAVSKNGNALEHASERLKDEKEVVLAAVANDGSVLKFASDRQSDDEEVVMVAVPPDDCYFGRHLRGDVDTCSTPFQFASPRLKEILEFAIDLVAKNPNTFSELLIRLRDNREVTLAAITRNRDSTRIGIR